MPDLDSVVEDAVQGNLDDLIGQLEALGIPSEPLRFEGERRRRALAILSATSEHGVVREARRQMRALEAEGDLGEAQQVRPR